MQQDAERVRRHQEMTMDFGSIRIIFTHDAG
jgi:hypothetical protein